MANNKQHVVATTNEILNTKSGKTLDRLVNKGGGGDKKEDVIVNIAITQYDKSGGFRAIVNFHSCNYDANTLNSFLDDLSIRDSINYYARIFFNNENAALDMNNFAFGPTPIKIPILGFESGSEGIKVYFIGPWIDTASGYIGNNKQYIITIPSNYQP